MDGAMATGRYEPTFQVAELIEAFRLQSKTGVLKVFHAASAACSTSPTAA